MTEIQRLIDRTENTLGGALSDIGHIEQAWKGIRENIDRARDVAEDLWRIPERSAAEIEEISQEIMRLLDVG